MHGPKLAQLTIYFPSWQLGQVANQMLGILKCLLGCIRNGITQLGKTSGDDVGQA